MAIVTNTGRAVVPANASEFSRLSEWFAELVPTNSPGFITAHPETGSICLFGALLGLLAGSVGYLFSHASETAIGWYAGGGSILGFATNFLILHIGDRWARVDLTQPIKYGTFGTAIGVFVSVAIGLSAGLNTIPIATIAGAVIGFSVGLKKSAIHNSDAQQGGQPERR